MKRTLLTVMATALCLAVTPVAAAGAADPTGGANNVVMATTSSPDYSELDRSGLQVAQIGGPTVSSTNLARADAHDCTGCRSVAVAFQTVFVTRGATTATPTNAAVATTGGCVSCTSFAFAYQYVLYTDGPVRLSADGQQRIAALRTQLDEAAHSGLGVWELDARLEELKAQFKATIDEEVGPAGGSAASSESQHVSGL